MNNQERFEKLEKLLVGVNELYGLRYNLDARANGGIFICNGNTVVETLLASSKIAPELNLFGAQHWVGGLMEGLKAAGAITDGDLKAMAAKAGEE